MIVSQCREQEHGEENVWSKKSTFRFDKIPRFPQHAAAILSIPCMCIALKVALNEEVEYFADKHGRSFVPCMPCGSLGLSHSIKTSKTKGVTFLIFPWVANQELDITDGIWYCTRLSSVKVWHLLWLVKETCSLVASSL